MVGESRDVRAAPRDHRRDLPTAETADMLPGRMTMDQGTASKGQSFFDQHILMVVFVETSARYVYSTGLPHKHIP